MKCYRHVNKVAGKIAKVGGILNKLKFVIPRHILLTIYNSLILQHLNYGITIWGFKAERLVKLQKEAVRWITLSRYNEHSEPLLKQLKLLKLEDIRFLQTLKFYYKLNKESCLLNSLKNRYITNIKLISTIPDIKID